MYSGDIQYMEHLVVNMTLEVSNSDTGSVNISQAFDLLIDYFVYDIDNNGAALVKRGDFEVSITSPSNTTSTLLFSRRHDTVNTEGYYQWPFLSVLHWGENPCGQWTINVTWTNPSGLGAGMVRDVSVQFYGVSSTFNDTASATCDDITASPSSAATADAISTTPPSSAISTSDVITTPSSSSATFDDITASPSSAATAEDTALPSSSTFGHDTALPTSSVPTSNDNESSSAHVIKGIIPLLLLIIGLTIFVFM